MTTINTLVSTQDVIDFVEHEADLADTHRVQEWLELWNPDRALYFVPYGDDEEGSLRVALIRDGYGQLCQRIQRLTSGSAHAQNPPSQLCRVMSRITTREGEDGSVVARSKFVCVESRPGRDVLWAGTTLHTVAVRPAGGGLELWRKEVRLVNSQKEIPPLAFLI
ncbi:hypothetical protein ORI20_26065 [Mycobacterium sp. CVI_P3]|uniref:Aromatic-ring-hydroxylating dioxygenase subunit beta n=1 Tax=Mycobacterium pinniadriaticum TaxID=2994102 RepID=A0ABT3SL32_9MYCO|nr:aromatic-ring-hydroxylating dioxygenase subunit beta [Mycobacterium pinniadriaticum]MCX2933741.1 hypothetical protein [Mycobacterium pinniadriaticum]MCX2940163.1 hypothetical protein [Mycobacterium pinniadriaticum]